MSQIICAAPIVAAIKKCNDILGPDRVWLPQNEGQQYFLDALYPYRNQLSAYSEKELRSWVSWMASELNAILSAEGFSIKLDDFPPDSFGFLSILDVMVQWLVKGDVRRVSHEGKEYPAVHFSSNVDTDDGDVRVFNAFMSDAHPHPVVEVFTQSDDIVYMTKADQAYRGFDLLRKVVALEASGIMPLDAGNLTFPMIDYDSEKSEPVDLSWLIGMQTRTAGGLPAFVAEAKQQTKYKKNERGARVKSAVVGRMMITSARMPALHIIIDEPYLEWHIRPGTPFPTFCAYWTPDDWKNPGNLEL